ncbi:MULTISPECIES: ATP-binding protein [unclassified Mesorhizobium]|uniref:ATP-binding protein n=1 Tax=unclassified Mesorhizobium TaxID=325217 RepID=UPI000FDCB600|nr:MULTISPECIES: ATP-binding protein [unclassified Mesorhizobium]TGT71812.1 sensor histidine kinase [Mesorhizobium sp. M2E.F.Ca.ET.166.01.1.1]TGV99474.1 sensor histidine kinase [Mesorhizobium sp. M2E.F.Ca.ET.154.01.1.1]
MNFRVSARTILHLGSELISSDGVAFYELIKNALDARAANIAIDVVYRLKYSIYSEILRELGEDRDTPEVLRQRYIRSLEHRRTWRELREVALVDGLVRGAPDLEELQDALQAARSRSTFIDALRSANRIDIDDNGEGMSLHILQSVYLTIGTSYRADQKSQQYLEDSEEQRDEEQEADGHDPDVILGEKGLGRLSAMRLGDRVSITTGEEGSRNWNTLDIDWNDFADAADADLQSVRVEPTVGDAKGRSEKGTLISITALRSEWSATKLQDLAIEHFSKLSDPLGPNSRLPLVLTFNGAEISIPRFADFLLEQAHGRFRARLIPSGLNAPRISGRMQYLRHNRSRDLRLSTLELQTLTDLDVATIERVGEFSLDVYWFNRRLLTKIEGIGNLTVVRRILAEWAGGVALYRDGYRVNPYGGPYDDWLDLDRDAFSTSGFKLNRGQVIGRARITQRGNPFLIDQTNREGLKENPEKQAFVKLLASIMELYRQYLNEVDRDIDRARRVTAAEALERFRNEDERLASLMPALESALRESEGGRNLTRQFRSTVAELRAAAELVQRAAGAQDRERSRVLHLASIGLMIESLAHELYRATAAGLETIAQARRSRNPSTAGTSLRVLDSQLRTLQKRLKVLDPLSTNARQTKETFELVNWVEDIVGGFASRNEGRRIEIVTRVVPSGAEIEVRAVKGMFVQVIENLLNNSVFWVAAQHRERMRLRLSRDDDDSIGRIEVTIDVRARRIIVTDDGPGIPEERRETVSNRSSAPSRRNRARASAYILRARSPNTTAER